MEFQVVRLVEGDRSAAVGGSTFARLEMERLTETYDVSGRGRYSKGNRNRGASERSSPRRRGRVGTKEYARRTDRNLRASPSLEVRRYNARAIRAAARMALSLTLRPALLRQYRRSLASPFAGLTTGDKRSRTASGNSAPAESEDTEAASARTERSTTIRPI